MAAQHSHRETGLNARELQVSFSENVKDAFRALTQIAARSKHIEPEIYSILKDWSSDKTTTVHDVMIAMPLIAEQVAEHISATGDEGAKDAWRALCTQMPEEGFTISQPRGRRR
jgi:hypothetical protein